MRAVCFKARCLTLPSRGRPTGYARRPPLMSNVGHSTIPHPHMLTLDFLLIVAFCVTMVVAPIAWLRMLMAKDQSKYLKNAALFVVPILLVFALASLTGQLDEPASNAAPVAEGALAPELTWFQVVLLALAGGTWLGGGSLLWFRHTKRVGRSWWSVLNPLQPQFRDFNTREWLILAALAVVSLSLGALAVHAA